MDEPGPAPWWSRELARAYWIPPVLIAFALSRWRLGRPALWRDELYTWDRATQPVADILGVLHGVESVFVPYYLFMHCWIDLVGASPAELRLPSALAMTAAAGVVAVLARHLFTPATGVVAGAVFTSVPAISRMGQEAKPHMFAVLFAALATLLLVRALDRPRWSRWLPYAAACSLVGFSHLLALVMLLGHGVTVLALARRRNRGVVVTWAAAAVGSTLPVLGLAVAGFAHRGPMAWLPLTSAQSVHDLPVRLISGSIYHLPGAALLAGLLLTVGFLSVAGQGRASWILAPLALVPPVVLLGAGLVQHVYHPRYLLYTVVAWSVLVAATLVRLPAVLAIALGVAIVVLGLPSQLSHRGPAGHGDGGVDAVAAVLVADGRTGDGVVLQGSAGDWLALGIDYHRARLSHGGASGPDLAAARCATGPACRVDALRLWVVCLGRHRDALDCLSPAEAAAVRQGYRAAPVRVDRDDRFTLALFQPVPPPS